MDKEQKNIVPFVKYHTGLSYLLSPAESRFLIHMVDVQYMKSMGYYTDWTRAEYMKRMGLNEYSYERCVRKFINLGLLSKTNNAKGNRVYYALNMDIYEKLVTILSSTNNVDKLIEFCDTKLKKGRTIASITQQEIDGLKSDHGLKKLHPSTYPVK